MKDKLTKEEVLHVAKLAKIEISEEELEMYQIKLKEILNQVDKIKEVNNNDDNLMIAPWSHNAEFRDDEVGEMLEPQVALKNVPRKSGNYIEVPVVISND